MNKKIKPPVDAEQRDIDLFSIDADNLDREWQDQPRNYYQIAVAVAEAKDLLARAEAKLDVVDAELRVSILKSPESYGLEKSKPSVDDVKALIILQDEHKTTQEKVFARKRSVDLHVAQERAMDCKKRALEKAVDLLLNNLWSAPRAPKDALAGKKTRRDRDED